MNESSAKRFLFACLIAFAVVAFGGCGGRKIPGLVPLQGTVTYDGAPLAWASLAFAPAPSEKGAKPDPNAPSQRVATAMTDEHGQFIASVLGVKGAIPGKYVVTVEKYIPNEDSAVEKWEKSRQDPTFTEERPGDEVFDAVSAIPLKYADKKTSGLEIVLEKTGSKDVQIELSK